MQREEFDEQLEMACNWLTSFEVTCEIFERRGIQGVVEAFQKDAGRKIDSRNAAQIENRLKSECGFFAFKRQDQSMAGGTRK